MCHQPAPILKKVQVSVRAHPRAARDRVRWEGKVLHVWTTRPALEGAANRAVLEAVARELGVAPSRLRLRTGERSRDKRIEVLGEAGA